MSPFGRRRDVSALAAAGDLDALGKAVGKRDDEEALAALVELDDPASIAPAVRASTGDPEGASPTGRLLAHFGRRAADPLVAMITGRDGELRAALWLGWLAPVVGVEPLLGALRFEGDTKSRVAAAMGLGRLAPPVPASVVDALVAALHDDVFVAAMASQSIERLHDVRFVAPLIESADNAPTKDHRHFALKPLQELASRPFLESCLHDDDPEVRRAATDALALMDANEAEAG